MSFIITPSMLVPRVNVPFNNVTSPPGLIQANTQDPFKKASKYGLVWVYFPLFFLLAASATYFYHAVTDRIRAAIHEDAHKETVFTTISERRPSSRSSENVFELMTSKTDKSTEKLYTYGADTMRPSFPSEEDLETGSRRLRKKQPTDQKSHTDYWSFRFVNFFMALFRYIFYRPSVVITIKKRSWELPTLTVLAIVILGAAMSFLYCFLTTPIFWQSMAYGSPPLSIRAGMMAVAMTPWIVALSSKANLISLMTGIGHERLNRLHRWGSYLCLALSITHAVPFWVQSARDPAGFAVWKTYFNSYGIYIFATGIAAMAPLVFLCVHSLPILRRKAYEFFVMLHVPVAIVYIGMLFWHCRNSLTSWQYLYATIGIWLISSLVRFALYLNWTNFRRFSWLVGDDASVTVLPENAIKVTIPTQMRWQPGQYVYLRMPAISVLENHPFTVSSLCTDDLPSDYGEDFRDMVLVFRPFGGFTKRLAEVAQEKGPFHVYRAFIDGPYGGLKRRLESFDQVVLIAGGSGVTALVSHLLDLIKRMRDGKAITRSIRVIWAMKRPDTLEWFREELRICRECAPPETVKCQFFITAAKRMPKNGLSQSAQPQLAIGTYFRDHINDAFQGIADKRASYMSKRNSAYIREEAEGDLERELQLRQENEDTISPLPRAHLTGTTVSPSTPNVIPNFSFPGANAGQSEDTGASPLLEAPAMPFPAFANPTKRQAGRDLALDIQTALDTVGPSSKNNPQSDNRASAASFFSPDATTAVSDSAFNFGFPSTPTEFQKNLMRFAFLPATARANDGWTTEYGRPDLPFMLRDIIRSDELGTSGKRTCVFVCGPPSMRVSVSKTVADMQKNVMRKDGGHDEIFLHAENYAL